MHVKGDCVAGILIRLFATVWKRVAMNSPRGEEWPFGHGSPQGVKALFHGVLTNFSAAEFRQ